MPVKEQKNGTWRWEDLEVGKKYYLGTHGGNLFSLGEDRHGVYIGEFKGVRVFLDREGANIRSYTSDPNAPVSWYGTGGDDEPSFPAINCTDEGFIPRGEPEAKVKKILEELAIDL
ncbi:MAG: hypothetical protein ABIJ18_03930 [archaeon]